MSLWFLGKKDTTAIGNKAEKLAEKHIKSAGLKIAKRNYRCKGGEIDIIAMDKNIVVFVEVRFRSRSDFGSAAESVTRNKQKRVIMAAKHFLLSNYGSNEPQCRFDVIGIQDNPPEINWIKNAFEDSQWI